jgi:hypothetical protein
MTTPGTWAGRLSGAIAAATIAIASGGPAAMIHPQTHPAAQAMTATTVAVNCPPPAAPVASQDGQPSC